ncbi:MAG: hypothetical protein RLZZ191_351 [Pseudomonadota bacterium]
MYYYCVSFEISYIPLIHGLSQNPCSQSLCNADEPVFPVSTNGTDLML